MKYSACSDLAPYFFSTTYAGRLEAFDILYRRDYIASGSFHVHRSSKFADIAEYGDFA